MEQVQLNTSEDLRKMLEIEDKERKIYYFLDNTSHHYPAPSTFDRDIVEEESFFDFVNDFAKVLKKYEKTVKYCWLGYFLVNNKMIDSSTMRTLLYSTLKDREKDYEELLKENNEK